MDKAKPIPFVVIEPQTGWRKLNIREIIRYKDLLYFMILRDVTVLYKQTILGFAWAILNPFFSMVVFSVVFGSLAKVPTNGIPYPIFSYVALLPWTYFSQALINSTNSLVNASQLLNKVYFPRIILPLTPVFSKLTDFVIAFIILIAMMLYYGIYPSLNIVYLIPLILLMILNASGIGMWLSAMAIQYRDVKFAITFLSQILMYAAPVVFPSSLILDKYGSTAYMLYGIYPMVGVIEGFRACLLGSQPMPWELIFIGTISTTVLFFSGFFYFRRMERHFADVA